ncbi:hypothetical protein VOLCADRAFT_95236 [Volvox carteri f. nagariensis]|uniref:Uncharacterized protein n=1 Tax=Volvox carteri f. nagariensis TaxID=3068 RepID=D8U6Z0_VOLCA|nr:uncharacterized protein VOLCADRAFT_95236 [Volvox carteri f. nagariensis]EFJ44522.1 hypothetical protein VOLCADRAFT_95236 [Volvox carteri f. nagariensis]|eukprot:XP_002954372.1 hypothetical protein VOLCADRAFT_95236 [Volvox carteri f. nagariensis]
MTSLKEHEELTQLMLAQPEAIIFYNVRSRRPLASHPQLRGSWALVNVVRVATERINVIWTAMADDASEEDPLSYSPHFRGKVYNLPGRWATGDRMFEDAQMDEPPPVTLGSRGQQTAHWRCDAPQQLPDTGLNYHKSRSRERFPQGYIQLVLSRLDCLRGQMWPAVFLDIARRLFMWPFGPAVSWTSRINCLCCSEFSYGGWVGWVLEDGALATAPGPLWRLFVEAGLSPRFGTHSLHSEGVTAAVNNRADCSLVQKRGAGRVSSGGFERIMVKTAPRLGHG